MAVRLTRLLDLRIKCPSTSSLIKANLQGLSTLPAEQNGSVNPIKKLISSRVQLTKTNMEVEGSIQIPSHVRFLGPQLGVADDACESESMTFEYMSELWLGLLKVDETHWYNCFRPSGMARQLLEDSVFPPVFITRFCQSLGLGIIECLHERINFILRGKCVYELSKIAFFQATRL